MQTFLPYPDFKKSASILDYKRLGKQRLENYQILKILLGNKNNKKGYHNHPAVLMWEGYELFLAQYYNAIIEEWVWRGYNNNMGLIDINLVLRTNDLIIPWWFNQPKFHRSHRARLIEKDRDFYIIRFPNDEGFNNGKYFWPDNKTKTFKII